LFTHLRLGDNDHNHRQDENPKSIERKEETFFNQNKDINNQWLKISVGCEEGRTAKKVMRWYQNDPKKLAS
jgi:hypothetical protein